MKNYHKTVSLDQLTIGQRVSVYRNEKKLTQDELAKKLLVSQKLVNAWENNDRPIQPQYIDNICKVLNITSSELLRGKQAENETVIEALGLTDESIEYLKYINKNRDISLLDSQYNIEFVGTFPVEGSSNLLIINTLNLILSTNCGRELLKAIGNYCYSDFENGYPIFNGKTSYNSIAPVDSSGDPIPANSIRFNVLGVREGCNIPLDVMRFALLRAIENHIDALRENAKGDVE